MASRGLGTLTLALAVELGAFTRGMNSAERQVDAKSRAMAKRMDAVGKQIGRSLLAFSGIAAAGVGLYVRNTIEAEKVTAQLAARINDTAGAAGRSLKELNAQAEKLQSLTIFDDEAIGEAQAALLTFTQVTGREFDRTIEAATDLATVMGTDVADAAKILGKALSDPEKGMTALKRAGVTLTEDQKALVKQFQDTGDIAAAQGVILDALAGKMGTAAEAARDTLGGALQGLQNAFNNLLEGDGGSAGVHDATKAINEFTDQLNSPQARQNVEALISALVKVAGFVGDVTDAFVKSGQQIGNVMGFIGNAANDILTGQKRLLEGDLEGARAAQRKFLGEYQNFVKETRRTRGDFDKAVGATGLRAADNTPGGRIVFIDPPGARREDGAADRAAAGQRAAAAATRENADAKRAASEAAREQEERERALADQVERAAEAQVEFNRQMEDLAAQLGGPLAESQLRYRREEEALRKQWAEGSIPRAQDLAKALADLHALRDRDAAAIREQADTGARQIEQMKEELQLLQATSQAERDRIAFRQANPNASEAQVGQAVGLSAELDTIRQQIDGADGIRAAFEDMAVNVWDEGIGAVDAFFSALRQQVAQLLAQQFSAKLFGQAGTTGGGLFGNLLSSIFGGGSTASTGSNPTSFLSAFGGSYANGTDFAPGGMSLVGERGPEIVNLPRGAQVIPNGKFGNMNITVNVPPMTEKRSAQQIANEVARKVAFASRGGR